MKEGEIRETCGTYRREVKFLRGFLGRKHEGKTRFGGHRAKYETNIKVGLK